MIQYYKCSYFTAFIVITSQFTCALCDKKKVLNTAKPNLQENKRRRQQADVYYLQNKLEVGIYSLKVTSKLCDTPM